MRTAGWTARMRLMSEIPSVSSGRRGSRITTSGRCSRTSAIAAAGVARAAHDLEPVADPEEPGDALAGPIVGIDDQQPRRRLVEVIVRGGPVLAGRRRGGVGHGPILP